MSKLPPDATLTFILNNGMLRKPSDWLAKVSNNIRALPRDRGPYCVRIGISGTGHSPNYLIEPITEPAKTPEDDKASLFDIPDTAHWAYLAARNTAYSGRNHEILVSGLALESWSTKTTTEREVGALLLRSLNAPRNGIRRR